MDQVDRIISQWHEERPDVDVSAVAIIGRISRLERLIRPRLDQTFEKHGLEAWEFDMLATLRRSGAPFRLSAGTLLEMMMITSGSMTNRIDRLEARGLIRREADSSDRRVVLVRLTDEGMSLVDAALPDHADNQLRLIASLSPAEKSTLISLLRKLHGALDTQAR